VNLETEFLGFIKKKNLFTQKDKLLLALSGGKDSVALFHLLKNTGFKFDVAHCNFKLRGEASDLDESFVRKLCSNINKLHVKSFETSIYAKKKKISTQMSARELRYEWFEELKIEHKYTALLTAHHLNDRIESFFLNISRGTGPKGMSGMPLESDFIKRPFLHTSLEKIEKYISDNNLVWTEDQSNAETKYKRNKIRYKIMPELKALNPGLEETFAVTFDRIEGWQTMFNEQFEQFKTHFIKNEVAISFLEKTAGSKLLFEEYVRPFGFTFQQVEAVFNGFKRGNVFETATHSIYISRLTISVLEKKERYLNLDIYEPGKFYLLDKTLEISKVNLAQTELDFSDAFKIYIDLSKVKWPLKLRYWQSGDRFFPFGMKGSKLVSDYLIDLKLEKTEKAEQIILEDTEKILWLVGKRSSEKVKISKESTEILLVQITSKKQF
jgi:tRNA(Ile)-lysidine synthase